MSAFVPTRTHIRAIVALALDLPRMGGPGYSSPLRYFAPPRPGAEGRQHRFRELSPETAEQAGQILTDEVVRSVRYRYPDSGDELPGADDWRDPYTHARPKMPTPAQGMRLLDCYEYQACEHPGWLDSEARSLIDALRHRLADEAIRRLDPDAFGGVWDWPPVERAAS